MIFEHRILHRRVGRGFEHTELDLPADGIVFAKELLYQSLIHHGNFAGTVHVGLG